MRPRIADAASGYTDKKRLRRFSCRLRTARDGGKEKTMKKARDQKPIHTIPDGVYEGGLLERKLRLEERQETTRKAQDAQGNGYPAPSSEKDGR